MRGRRSFMARRVFRAVFVFAFALLLASCGGSEENRADVLSRLHGDWIMDLEASIAADAKLREKPGRGKAARGLAKTMLGEMTLGIDVKNSTISGSMIGSPLPLREFEVVSAQGNEVAISTEGSIIRFEILDDGMRLHAANGDVLIFKRR